MTLNVVTENGEEIYTTNEPHCIPQKHDHVFFNNRLFSVEGVVHEILPLNVYSVNVHVKEIVK
jgi:hypothetical protein